MKFYRKLRWLDISFLLNDESVEGMKKSRNKKYWVGDIAIKNDGSAGLP